VTSDDSLQCSNDKLTLPTLLRAECVYETNVSTVSSYRQILGFSVGLVVVRAKFRTWRSRYVTTPAPGLVLTNRSVNERAGTATSSVQVYGVTSSHHSKKITHKERNIQGDTKVGDGSQAVVISTTAVACICRMGFVATLARKYSCSVVN
jgi:hypothetical protein